MEVHPKAAWELLVGDPERFNRLLCRVNADIDLVDVEPNDINEDWPIYDRVVKTVTGNDRDFWKPLCQELRKDGKALHQRLGRLHRQANLAGNVTHLRAFDVIAWMEERRRY